jgi:hypothetical protein
VFYSRQRQEIFLYCPASKIPPEPTNLPNGFRRQFLRVLCGRGLKLSSRFQIVRRWKWVELPLNSVSWTAPQLRQLSCPSTPSVELPLNSVSWAVRQLRQLFYGIVLNLLSMQCLLGLLKTSVCEKFQKEVTSRMWRLVALVKTDVSKGIIASIMKVKDPVY